jgi:hypothetical protein
MKFKWLLIIGCGILLMPALAIGDAYEGSVQSFTCITQGKVCPVGREDPMIAAEGIFVLHVKAGDYYFIPNVDRAILARHLNQMVKVEGVKSDLFNAVKASDIYVMDEGKWVKTWSQNWQDEIFDEITTGVPLGGS